MDMTISEVAADMATTFRKQIQEKSVEPTREIIVEFAAALLDQEMNLSDASVDMRAGAVIFIKHRIMRHGGEFKACNQCLGA